MSQRDNVDLQELLTRAQHKEKKRERWAYFALHLFFAIILTAIAWVLVLTRTEELGGSAILITLLAFFGCLFHLRSALYDSGMRQPTTSEILLQELVRRGVDLNTLVASTGEKPKRAAMRLGDDGELITEDSTDEQPDRHYARQSGQR